MERHTSNVLCGVGLNNFYYYFVNMEAIVDIVAKQLGCIHILIYVLKVSHCKLDSIMSYICYYPLILPTQFHYLVSNINSGWLIKPKQFFFLFYSVRNISQIKWLRGLYCLHKMRVFHSNSNSISNSNSNFI